MTVPSLIPLEDELGDVLDKAMGHVGLTEEEAAIRAEVEVTRLRDALDWHSAGHRVSLFKVVQTWGSAPRPPGALLAIRDDGVVSGSVSGGCVEDDLIARTQAVSGRSGS